ncbi:TonB-dependent receptor [Pseudomaricurvus alcaniphilus]|uniref:TonB-dependent receptor n=1 Tax=Pseudomaricurvus alcaniphilus TaxID=1166482 RepID=UPI00140938A6|nr:TonB-dependent receptor [Pseudomaricurvus alcaniphilus]NHN39209.1 TonB-dependent receptor [Pseudomaricurvus alcaniphilus]
MKPQTHPLLHGAATAVLALTLVPTANAALEEIVVTAQKREESQQEVPISISSFTGQGISDFQTVDLSALSGASPNVQIGHFGNTPHGAVFNIRGMGVIEPDPYAGQTVTTVVDGVPLAFNMLSLLDLYDIERIEVHRGPQGTLFGANTTGGVINVITRQPTGEAGGDLKVTLGNWNRVDVKGTVNLPINEQWAAKFTGQSHKRDGWTRNVVDASTMGDRDISSLRGYLKYDSGSTFDATLIAEVTRARNGSPIVTNGSLPGEVTYQAPGSSPGAGLGSMYQGPCSSATTRCKAPDKYLSANSSVQDVSDMDTYSTTLTMNWDLDWGQLVAITGYKDFELYEETDQDGGVFFIDDTRRGTEGRQLSQELRLTFNLAENTEIISGLFYQQNDWTHYQNFRIPFAGPLNQLTEDDWENWSTSIFTHAFIDLTDRLRLQVGARASYEETDAMVDVVTFANTEVGGSSVFDGGVAVAEIHEKGSEDWDGWAAKVGLDYKINEDIMAYAFISRGFKSGGFVGRISLPEEFVAFDQETVQTFEAGIKSEWLDNRLRVNASYFFNKYDDLQLALIYFCTDSLGTTINCNSVLNAAQAETQGLELEIEAAPIDGLMITASMGYLDATYEEFPFLDPASGNTLDRSGTDLQNSPELTASIGATYQFPLLSGSSTLGFRWTYSAEKFQGNLLNTPRGTIQPTKYLDANFKWEPENGSWAINLWGTNLLDDRYIDAVVDAPGFIGLMSYGPPRQVGVSLEYMFN